MATSFQGERGGDEKATGGFIIWLSVDAKEFGCYTIIEEFN